MPAAFVAIHAVAYAAAASLAARIYGRAAITLALFLGIFIILLFIRMRDDVEPIGYQIERHLNTLEGILGRSDETPSGIYGRRGRQVFGRWPFWKWSLKNQSWKPGMTKLWLIAMILILIMDIVLLVGSFVF